MIAQPPTLRVSAQEMLLDGITPIAAYAALRGAWPDPSFLLESAPGAGQLARHSIIGVGVAGELIAADGDVTLSIRNERCSIEASGLLEAARSLLRACKPADLAPALAPFLGAYGVAAFELAGYFERLERLPYTAQCVPDLHLIVPRSVVVFDHFTHKVTVMTLHSEDETGDYGAILSRLLSARISPLAQSPAAADLQPAPAPLPFPTMVEKAKAAIVAGEIFQVVLSQVWTSTGQIPFSVYRSLRSINPSPYMFYLDFGRGTLLGSSPEMLCKLDGRRAQLRPLAGTRPRPQLAERERELLRQLRRDPKERAEHVMLVDLGRNDLGRVCEYGSVRVTELLAVERYSHVMHLVSEVRGTLRSECDAFDLFAATFPAGTVSGAPKIRAMQLIAQFEQRRRGYYGGSVVRFGFDGSLDACIVLRSAYVRDGVTYVAAGAGIVADSDPASEDAECRAKARAVEKALEATGAITP